MTARPLVLAHRGYRRKAAENTFESIAAARAIACDGAEFDVRALRDGTPVLHHDASFRIGGQEHHLSALGPDDARRLRPSIATLARVLEWAAQQPGFLLDVEFKDPRALAQGLRLLDAHRGPFAVTGFSLDLAAGVQRQKPTWRVGWISDERREDLAKVAAETGLGLVVIHRRHASARLLEDARGRGVEVWVWGVDLRFQARALASRGVTAVISDRPRWVLGGRR